MSGVIVIDAGRSRPTCLRRDAYIHDHCLDILGTMRSSINCSAVICSPTVIHAIMREATSETYGPRVSFLLYCISFIYMRLVYYFAIFTFQSIQQKYQKCLLYCLY